MIKRSLDVIQDVSTGLSVIDPHNKAENEDDIVRARSLIRDAEVIYFLGFGFDQNDCRRLGLDRYVQRTRPNPEAVLFTNFRDSGRANKDAAKASFGVPLVWIFEMPEVPCRFDKSTRDVYDTFVLDFDAPEQD